MTTTNTVNAARSAELALIDQIHKTAESVATIGTDNLTLAIAHLKHECDGLKSRLNAGRAAMCSELGSVLAELTAFTAEIEQGMTPEPEQCPLLGVAAVNPPSEPEPEPPTRKLPWSKPLGEYLNGEILTGTSADAPSITSTANGTQTAHALPDGHATPPATPQSQQTPNGRKPAKKRGNSSIPSA